MNLTSPIFQDADKAREHLEKLLWPNGPVCPHCGVVDGATALKGKAHRVGLYQCNACREQFTVTVGTVFERSKVPLNKWLLASFLMSSSKKGISAHQISRTIGVTYKTAWFMCHRIRGVVVSSAHRLEMIEAALKWCPFKDEDPFSNFSPLKEDISTAARRRNELAHGFVQEYFFDGKRMGYYLFPSSYNTKKTILGKPKKDVGDTKYVGQYAYTSDQIYLISESFLLLSKRVHPMVYAAQQRWTEIKSKA